MKNKSVAIIGGGAAGLFAAITTAQCGHDVTLFEKNRILGKKLLITGKGRCNVTNNCLSETVINNTPTNPKFLYSALNMFTPEDTMSFFENLGVKLKTERGNRVFPVSDKSTDIVNALIGQASVLGVKIINETVKCLTFDLGAISGLKTDISEYNFDSVIVCTGGLSYPKTGSTGDGYRFAKTAGHTVTELKPSLVPLESKDRICKELQGLSLKNINFSVTSGSKMIFEEFGEMIFTHFGISGPVVLSASSRMKSPKQNEYIAHIDLKPALSEEKLDERVRRDFNEMLNKSVKNSLDKLLPKKMIPVIIERSGIDPDKKVNTVTKEERKRLIECLKDLKISVSDFRPIEEAIVTSGGISVKEIDPKTMKSKLIDGLYFAGEIIDVDAYTGGFNLQIAFSTAYAAAVAQ